MNDAGGSDRLVDWLGERGLQVFTLNGFPFGDFHEPVVKKRVYSPDWSDPARFDYTMRLARLLARLLGDGPREGGISTLPIGWRSMADDPGRLERATRQLSRAVEALRILEAETGALIHLDLEPEPGCVLDRSTHVNDLFARLDEGAGDPDRTRRYLRVCHDICHAAVMFEEQSEALERYSDQGVLIGKVQVSSAIRVHFDQFEERERSPALDALREFVEPKYLHQTVVSDEGNRGRRFFEDLPEAIEACANAPTGEWRTHFHVPIFLDAIGPISTTRDEIEKCIQALRGSSSNPGWEIETYAWSALPASYGEPSLIHGIADEIEWFSALIDRGEST